MKKISLLLIGLLLLGCTKKNPTITITNTSNETYDSIYVYATSSNPTIFKDIKVDEKVSGNIKFDNSIKGDGSYTIKLFQKNNPIKQKSFGYFTNGSSLNSSFKIIITKDSIKIN